MGKRGGNDAAAAARAEPIGVGATTQTDLYRAFGFELGVIDEAVSSDGEALAVAQLELSDLTIRDRDARFTEPRQTMPRGDR